MKAGHDQREDEVGAELHAAADRARDDRGGGGGEHHLEEEVGRAREASAS
jgi:hypothetical protein